jgi:hypothetical protein
VAIAEALGLTPMQWRPALASFRGLPHRMERVAEANGVLYINDSKATNPASTAPALAAVPTATRTPHPLDRGRLPKGDRLDECAPFFGNVAAAYTIGDAGPKFAELLTPYMPVRRSEMMCEAIREAMAAAKPGDVVMLSPACASFDQFRDYEARGDAVPPDRRDPADPRTGNYCGEGEADGHAILHLFRAAERQVQPQHGSSAPQPPQRPGHLVARDRPGAAGAGAGLMAIGAAAVPPARRPARGGCRPRRCGSMTCTSSRCTSAGRCSA